MTKILPNTFTIQIPGAWTSIPLEKEEAAALIDRTWVGPTIEGISPDDVTRAKALLGKLVVEATAVGVVFAASYFDLLPAVVEDANRTVEGENLPILLSAVALLGTIPSRDISSDGMAVSTDSLMAALATPASKDKRYLQEPEMVILPAGAAVEIRAIEVTRVPNLSDEVTFYSVTYYLPVSAGEGLAILTFRTPSLGLTEEFTALFRTIADTLEFTREEV